VLNVLSLVKSSAGIQNVANYALKFVIETHANLYAKKNYLVDIIASVFVVKSAHLFAGSKIAKITIQRHSKFTLVMSKNLMQNLFCLKIVVT
jgi:hypothetical protein